VEALLSVVDTIYSSGFGEDLAAVKNLPLEFLLSLLRLKDFVLLVKLFLGFLGLELLQILLTGVRIL
jgi:hypothetical protein